MNIHEWNRKDACPEDTISRIKKILADNAINISTISETQYQDLWYSNRIEIDELSHIGTNGKGISPEYTMASALGELMERLQCGMLLQNLFVLKNSCLQRISQEQPPLINGAEFFFSKVFRDLGDRTVKTFLEECSIGSSYSTYEVVGSNLNFQLPERMIGVFCGSTGAAAGNTFEEAFVQGLSEIFERYVTQYIYKETYSSSFAIIDEAAYKNFKSYKLIQAIAKKGYHVLVIDCSLNGILPVIGVLLFDSSRKKYFMKLGADANADIALQRCITEIFQGSTFDLSFKFKMNNFINADSKEKGFWFGSNRKFEHIKAEVDGTGELPRAFFKCLSNTVTNIKGFSESCMNNKQAMEFMIDCCKQISKEVAIANHTKIGFPCIRILLTDSCLSMHYPGVDIFEAIHSINKFRTLVQQRKAQTRDALECMIAILNYPAYSYEFSMTKLIGVVLKSGDLDPYLYDPYVFTAYLALRLGEYQTAYRYLERSNRNETINPKNIKVDLFIIKAIENGVTQSELVSYVELVDRDNKLKKRIDYLYGIKTHGMRLPMCPDCEQCPFKEECAYQSFFTVNNCVEQVNEPLTSQFDAFVQECREAWQK